MSKKRSSDECNNDEQALLQRQDNVKRTNVDSNSDTTLQDLPMELLECILVKVVATEVMGLKLVKSVWKEKADQVISRLGTVCSQWSSVLTTNSFRIKLHRILDGTAEERFRLEVVHEFPTIHSKIGAVTAMNDEIFILYQPYNQDSTIYVYDRNNTAVVKDVIPLPGRNPVCIAACKASNCVYVGLRNKCGLCLSILRISKDAEHQFSISPWMEDHRLHIYTMSVSANGSLIMISEKNQWDPQVVSIYDANGFLQQEIKISRDIDSSRYKGVVQRSNGNFILVHSSRQTFKMMLSEIDSSGSVVRQYQSSQTRTTFASFADISGRIMIAEHFGRIDLLDSEFNLQGTYRVQQDKDKHPFLVDLHYDSERNEILRIFFDWRTDASFLTILRLTEE